MTEGELLWTPDPATAAETTVARFMRWLAAERGRAFADYEELRRWSVTDLDGFWAAVWDFFDVQSSQPYERVLSSREMPGAVWFEGSRVNYAEHLLRHERDAAPDEAALVHSSELRPLARMSWHELGGAVRVLATQLRALGVGPGDRVVAYMPNIPETVIAMLAATAIGAVWASAAPEFGARTVIDRFAQIEPKLLFAADGYRFGGKDFDRADEIRTILAELPAVERVVWLPYLDPASRAPFANAISWPELMDHPPVDADAFTYERVRARSSAVGAVLVRHDGLAEADRARARRHAGRAPQEHRPRAEPRPAHAHVLLHDDGLDDVQRARLRARARLVGGAVRRASGAPDAGAALAARRRCGRDVVRREPDVRADDAEDRSRPARALRPLALAERAADRLAGDAGIDGVVLRSR